jgi:hypothetical protein
MARASPNPASQMAGAEGKPDATVDRWSDGDPSGSSYGTEAGESSDSPGDLRISAGDLTAAGTTVFGS